LVSAGDNDSVYLWRTDCGDLSEIDYVASACTFFETLAPVLPAEGNIVIKPNVTVPSDPEAGIIVHPDFVGGLLDSLIARAIRRERLYVIEGHIARNEAGRLTWDVTGYTKMAETRGVALLEVDDDRIVDVPVPEGVVYNALPLSATLAEASIIINVPIAKCHNLALTTLAVKNMMGMVAEPSRHFCTVQSVDDDVADRLMEVTPEGLSFREERWCHKVCDLASAVKRLPGKNLHVVSGILGRDGTGFGTGNNYLLNIIAASENPVHVDAVVTYLMGIDPMKTPYLNIAMERGMGTNRIEEIEVIDLRSGSRISMGELAASVHSPAFVPLARSQGGYQPRFREDGTLEPWMRCIHKRPQRQNAARLAA